MNTYCYFASIQKSTSVTCSLLYDTGTEKRLLVAKKNRVEVSRLSEGGLVDTHEVNLWAQVVHLASVPDKEGSALVVFTDQRKVIVADRDWKESDHVELEPDLKKVDSQPLFAQDPLSRVFCANYFSGHLHFFWVTRGSSVTLKPVVTHFLGNYSMKVLDMVFLQGCETPRLCVLVQEDSNFHLKLFEVSQAQVSPLLDWAPAIKERGRLLAPTTGAVAVACPSALWLSSSTCPEPALLTNYSFGQITAVAQVNPNEWMLANADRHLVYVKLTPLVLLDLGEATRATSITYLDNAYFFLGSYTDCALVVRVNAASQSLEVVSKTQNLSPLVDMQVLTSEFHSAPEFVLASCLKPGAVTLMSKDINVQIEATVDVGKVTGMWPASKAGSGFYDFLVLSYLAETRVQELSNFTLTPVDLPGFDLEASTLLAGNLDSVLCQVTAAAVLLSDASSALCSFRPTSTIQQASLYNSHILLVTSDNVVSYLTLSNRRLNVESTWQAPHDISCVVVGQGYAVVGVWSEFTIRIMKLPDLAETWREQVSVDVLPRALFLKTMGTEERLFCGLGDGNLLVYNFKEGQIDNQRNMQVGREAVQFSALGDNRVLISSASPKVAFLHDSQLRFSKFNLENVQTMCSFANPDIPDCLAAVINNQLTLMRAESIQLLSLMRYYPGRLVQKVQVFDDNFVLFASTESEPEQYFLQVIEKVSELSYQYPLDDDEKGVSLLVQGRFILVGTTNEKLESGSLRVFTFVRRELTAIAEQKLEGPPLCMRVLGEQLCVTMGRWVSVWRLSEEGTLTMVSKAKRPFSVLVALDCREDVVAVGDMIKAVTLFRLVDGELQEFAGHTKVFYVADVVLMSSNLVLVSDIRCNVVLFRYGGTKNLELVASWGMQEKLTCLRVCPVTTLMAELELRQLCYYASADGAVGLVTLLNEERYEVLKALQEALLKRLVVFRSLSYPDMRQLVDYRPKDASNFVDGDLLQQFMQMSTVQQETIAMELATSLSQAPSVKELQKLVSCFSLLH